MCGIIGYCGPKRAPKVLVEGLKRLEYRGYDSAGIGVVADGSLQVIKKVGKIRTLTEHIPENLPGDYGIGHTRWATHGVVNETNAHPHTDCSGRIAVAHNGIIENYESLKEVLQSEDHIFKSDTDSEVIVHLIGKYYRGDLETAVREAVALLNGTYGIVCIHADEPNRIVGARNGSPLVVGVGDNEMFLASDVTAVIAHTKQVIYLEDGEVVTITPTEYRTTDFADQTIEKEIERVSWELQAGEGVSRGVSRELQSSRGLPNPGFGSSRELRPLSRELPGGLRLPGAPGSSHAKV